MRFTFSCSCISIYIGVCDINNNSNSNKYNRIFNNTKEATIAQSNISAPLWSEYSVQSVVLMLGNMRLDMCESLFRMRMSDLAR